MARCRPRSGWTTLGVAALLTACGEGPSTPTRETPLPPLPTVTTTTTPTTTLVPYYDVQRGDTLDAIAQKVGVPVADLVAANAIANPDRIEAGQRLIVPRPPPAAGTSSSVSPPPASP